LFCCKEEEGRKVNMNMTNKEAVLLSNPTARLNIYGAPGERQGFWIKCAQWETKVTFSEDRAWQLAYRKAVVHGDFSEVLA
jgi:hypothetical protein